MLTKLYRSTCIYHVLRACQVDVSMRNSASALVCCVFAWDTQVHFCVYTSTTTHSVVGDSQLHKEGPHCECVSYHKMVHRYTHMHLCLCRLSLLPLY